MWQTLTPGHVVWWWYPRLTITSEMVGEEGREEGREGGSVGGEDEGRVGRKGRREGRREQVLGGRKWRVTQRRGEEKLG